MPAASTTASTMVERGRRGCIRYSQRNMISKRRIMIGLPAAASTRADRWVCGCALPPVSWKIHLLEYVGRFAHLDHSRNTERAGGEARSASISLCMHQVTFLKRDRRWGRSSVPSSATPPVLDGAVVESGAMVAAGAVVTEVDACSAGTRTGTPSATPRRRRLNRDPMIILRLTFLSNVVAYACRPSSTKDRRDVHQHRLLGRRGTIGGRRHDAHGLPWAHPRRSNGRRKGRKGRKPRIRRKTGSAGDAAERRNRRKLAETLFGRPIAVGKYSWRGCETPTR